MALVVESFNGTDINTAAYAPRLHASDGIESTSIASVVQRPAGRDGRFMRADVVPRIVPLHISIISGGSDAGQIALAQIFTKGTEGEFVVTYNGVSRALTCRVERTILYDQGANQFTAVLVAEDPLWHSSALQTVTQQQTVSAATWSVANDGNAADYKGIYTLQPKTAKTAGYTFKRELIVANRVARPFANYALMFTIDHATLTTVKSQADGDDIRVRVDGVETPRWPSTQAGRTWDTATLDIWFNLTLSPGKFAALLADCTAAAPANGGDLEVVKGGTSGWPTTGALLIDDEVLTYTGITLKNASGREAFTGVTRAARNTTAAIHTTTDVIYWVERRVQLLYGYAAVTAPDARNEQKPMLDLTSATLTNTSHQWLDMAHATDPRSMQWARRSVVRDDQEPRFIRAATGSPAAALAMTFDPDGPSVGNPLFNQWERDFPSGTDGNIAITRTIDDTMALQVFSLDADGNELRGTDANNGLLQGPLASASENHDPGDVYGLRVWAFNQIVAQNNQPLADTLQDALPVGVSTQTEQRFLTGTEPVTITHIAVRVQDDASARTLTLRIHNETGGAPTTATLASGTAATSGAGALEWVTAALTTPVTLPPSTSFFASAYTAAGIVSWSYQLQPYSGGGRWSGSSILYQHFNFRLIGYAPATAASLVRFDDNCLADDGDSASVTALTVPLLAAGVPYLNLMAEQVCYWLSSLLSNNTTAQTITFDVICEDEDEIEVDVGRRTVRNVTKGENVMFGTRFSDPDEWIRLAPGTNTFALVESGIARVDVISETYDRYS